MAAGGPPTPDDDSTFKDYILYVLTEGDRNSTRAIHALHGNSDIFSRTHIQDVKALRSRPSFLTGVPILLDKVSGLAYRGTEVFRFFERTESEGPTSATGVVGRRLKKTSRLAAGSAMRTRGNFMSLNDAFGEISEDAPATSSSSRSSGGERTMEEFERLRSSVDHSAKKAQAGSGTMFE